MEDQEKIKDLYILVRGVNIPRIQIDQIEGMYGAKLVPDEDWRTLLLLDKALKIFRSNNENKDPEFVVLADKPELKFKHMVLKLNFLGMEIPGSMHKPAWFYWKRTF